MNKILFCKECDRLEIDLLQRDVSFFNINKCLTVYFLYSHVGALDDTLVINKGKQDLIHIVLFFMFFYS